MELTIEQALQKAIEAHKAGKLQDAEALYRAILSAQPKHPDANHNLGVLAVSLNKSELALPLFKTALEANPKQGQFWMSYVDGLIKAKQFDIARDVLGQGKILGLAGERVNALEAQLTPIAVVEKSESILQKQASSFTQQRKKASTKKEKKKNSSSNQKNPNQVRNLCQMEVHGLVEHYQTGQYDLAENLAKNLINKYPDHQLSWKVLGAVFNQKGRFQEALIANQKAVEISPNDADAHCILGVTLNALYRLEDAKASYKKAIAIKPEHAEAHSNLGNTLRKLGRLKDAEASYKKTLAIRPDLAEAHYNLAITLDALFRLEDAKDSYKKAIAIKPEYAEAYNNLGKILKELGSLAEAEVSYKKAIAIKPDYAEAHSNLGITLRELGKLEETEALYKKAIVLKPNFEQAHYNLGILYCEQGKYKLAAEQLSKLKTFKDSQSYLLKCWYFLDEQILFYKQLDFLINQGETNAIIGSFSSRAEIKYGVAKSNPFCNSPLRCILKTNLSNKYDFQDLFVKPTLSILNDIKIQKRTQTLLANGIQTAGNLFALEDKMVHEIKRIIGLEIEEYRSQLNDSNEGFIKNWPDAYTLYGWVISMKSGGVLSPHMHENGWISGSVYINVPPKSSKSDGNLVVCIEDDKLLNEPEKNQKNIIDVTTGSLCLFPASLLHYTIPFESDEDRIVLAFDVIPESFSLTKNFFPPK